ncbi:TetR/AcrR family transcriptional regulator [Brachybacterium squillarum]|uniref:TetR/AcrR family transcriptional regulator n=1 Tax=Brachybacterium squillarum TaxID=661979 RepID=UPI001584734D|nr:TetR/AcrR family transcriptional regulator [Brachybacterium squillarum]
MADTEAHGAPQDLDPLLRAAIGRFSREGFGAPLRAIAADAGVSAALLVKRYGSKEALHEAADEAVLEWIRRVKSESIGSAARGTLMLTLPAAQREASVLLGYIVHAVLDGGALGRHLLDQMVTDAEGYIAEAVAQGLARPSRDERARARYLVQSGLGSLLVSTLLGPSAAPPTGGTSFAAPPTGGTSFAGTPPAGTPSGDTRSADGADTGRDVVAMLHRLEEETTLPALELYTEGFFTGPAVFEQYLAGRDRAASDPTEREATP